QDPDAKKFAIEQHDVKVLSPEEDASLTPGQFNLITMFHVLEHLPDVHSTMRKLCSWLAPDGRLVIAVPNHQSYDAEVYGPYWAAWDVPRHLHHFSRNSIISLAEKHGLTIRKIYPMYWDAFFVAMLSDRYKGDHNSFVRAGLLGLKSNLKAIRSGQYSSLMFILGKSR
ncbi:MAG TPA: class I SAM-dependent methyltransferase, partial [Bacteroidales bacterium]|nr:class I SAM-dependent methyltransferase [Bacteroidales bacterium]